MAQHRYDGTRWPQPSFNEIHPQFPSSALQPEPEPHLNGLESQVVAATSNTASGAHKCIFTHQRLAFDKGKGVADRSVEVTPELDLFTPYSTPLQGKLTTVNTQAPTGPAQANGNMLPHMLMDPEWAYGVPKMMEGPLTISLKPTLPLHEKKSMTFLLGNNWRHINSLMKTTCQPMLRTVRQSSLD
ncbi:hypothetical protein PIB30_073655 [Stylosanthes scabra]|uniref:Uncharacterized protein n=1 Tax=Stylosanthes scabra TaxID=79078 RepID=A0ABU6UT45_9FABA|nr:hypothetical protein [Stylosanthes scabra]